MPIKQKRVCLVYFSMIRRNANCASLVMLSHSSKMISLKPLLPKRMVEAKDWISLRTTSMPRSGRVSA